MPARPGRRWANSAAVYRPPPATQLGATALTGAIERSGIDPGEIDYVVMGNMLSAGLGQTPARQAAISAGIPETTSAITFNKACASGMAAVIAGSQMIQLGEAETVAAGGMENMSAAPHLLVNSRTGQRLGDREIDRLNGPRRTVVPI